MNENIGKKLRNLRGERSRAEIAKKLGVSVSAIAMYEQGKRIPKDTVKIKIASLYSTSVEKIFYS